MTPTTPDDDWLYPDATVEPSTPPPPPTRIGCWRFDSQCDRPQRFDTLAEAIIAGPPLSPDATIERGTQVLAYAADDRAEWLTTEAGKSRIDMDAHEAERTRALGEVA